MPSARAAADHVAQLVGPALTDEVAHRVVRDQQLERGDETAADSRQQSLRHDRRQRRRELHPDLGLAFGREDVGDAVERLRRVVRVQGREHEVAGLGERERELDRLRVAHLTDEDDVGVFAQRRPQRPRERLRVDTDLALVDRGDSVLVRVLDRVLDREDVHRPARLMYSIIDASVVDLPDPVGPVTRTNPCLKSHAAASAGGMPISPGVGTASGIARIDIASSPLRKKQFARKRCVSA